MQVSTTHRSGSTRFLRSLSEVAQSYLYLMTNRYCTGQTVVVDGGGVLV